VRSQYHNYFHALPPSIFASPFPIASATDGRCGEDHGAQLILTGVDAEPEEEDVLDRMRGISDALLQWKLDGAARRSF
jgi:hypothetical protein